MKVIESTVVDYSFTLLEECGLVIVKVAAFLLGGWLFMHVLVYATLKTYAENQDLIKAAICYSG